MDAKQSYVLLLNSLKCVKKKYIYFKKRPCYFFLDCMWTCGEWQSHSKTQAKNICTIVKKRSCYSSLLGETRIEYNNTKVGK